MRKTTFLVLFLSLISFRLLAQIPENWRVKEATDVYNDLLLSAETTEYTEGTQSLKMTLTQGNVPYLFSGEYDVNQGAVYTFSLDVLDNDANGKIKVYAEFKDATGDDIYGETPVYSEDNAQWQTISWSGTVPDDAVKGYIWIKFYSEDSFTDEANIMIDNASFVEAGGSNVVPNNGFETWVTPTADVTFTVIDGTESHSTIMLKGTFNDWTNTMMYDDGTHSDASVGDHVWTLAVSGIEPGDHEWGVVDGNDTWLLPAGENQTFMVTYYGAYSGDDSFEVPGIDVTFNVDMSDLSSAEFNPAGGDFVDIGGSWNGYTGSEHMTDTDGDGIYTLTVGGMFTGVVEYKYRINGNWESAEFPNGDNRTYTVVDGDNVVNDVWNDRGEMPTTIDESFEDGIPGDWTVINNDGIKGSWESSDDENVPNTGTFGVRVDSYDAGSAGEPNDDWLITPKISVIEDYVLSFWARSRSGSYPDGFKIFVSKTGNAVEDFTIELDDISAVPELYTKYQYTLTDNENISAGDEIYIAVQSYVEGSMLYMDDFWVGEAQLGMLMAYSISETAIDVRFDSPINTVAVDATDYELTGTTTVTFSDAAIDANDNTILHLTGASENVTFDVALDQFTRKSTSENYEFYAGVAPLAYTFVTNPDGTIELQTPATFTGIVTTKTDVRVWIADTEGAYGAINTYGADFADAVEIGDEVLFTGEINPVDGQMEVIKPVLVSKISTGNEPYGPYVIAGSDINNALDVDTDPAEKYEGALVTINGATVESLDAGIYTLSDDNGVTYFTIEVNSKYNFFDGTLEDLLSVGNTYNVTGVVIGRDKYYLTPRNADDIADITSVEELEEKAQIRVYPNPVRSFLTVENIGHASKFVISDMTGKVLQSATVEDKSINIPVSQLTKGVYFITFYSEKQLPQTVRFIKQ